jgi:hypothetical protein
MKGRVLTSLLGASIAVTLGVVLATLWLGLSVLGWLWIFAVDGVLGESPAMRAAQVGVALVLLFSTTSLATVLSYLGRRMGASLAIMVVVGLATASLLSVGAAVGWTREQNGCEPSVAEWLPLLVPCPD